MFSFPSQWIAITNIAVTEDYVTLSKLVFSSYFDHLFQMSSALNDLYVSAYYQTGLYTRSNGTKAVFYMGSGAGM